MDLPFLLTVPSLSLSIPFAILIVSFFYNVQYIGESIAQDQLLRLISLSPVNIVFLWLNPFIILWLDISLRERLTITNVYSKPISPLPLFAHTVNRLKKLPTIFFGNVVHGIPCVLITLHLWNFIACAVPFGPIPYCIVGGFFLIIHMVFIYFIHSIFNMTSPISQMISTRCTLISLFNHTTLIRFYAKCLSLQFSNIFLVIFPFRQIPIMIPLFMLIPLGLSFIFLPLSIPWSFQFSALYRTVNTTGRIKRFCVSAKKNT